MDRKKLLDILNLASSALSTQDVLPILSHFCFDGDTVTAYNDIQAININFPSEIRGGVPGQLLIRTLATFPSDKVTVEQASRNALEVRCGKSFGKFAVLGEEHFLFSTKDLELDDTVEIELTDEYISGIQKCLVSVGNDPTHSYQLGITLAYSKKGVGLYSTDNTSISRYVISKGKANKSGSAIIPVSFCNVLLSFLKSYKTQEAVLRLGGNFAYVTIGKEVRLFTKLVEDKRPVDFEVVIKAHTEELDFDEKIAVPEDLKSVLERSLIFHSKIIDKSMLCKVEKDTMLTLTEADGVGKIEDSITFSSSLTDEAFTFKVDPQNLMRVVEFCEEVLITPQVTVFFDTNYTHLVSYYKE